MCRRLCHKLYSRVRRRLLQSSIALLWKSVSKASAPALNPVRQLARNKKCVRALFLLLAPLHKRLVKKKVALRLRWFSCSSKSIRSLAELQIQRHSCKRGCKQRAKYAEIDFIFLDKQFQKSKIPSQVLEKLHFFFFFYGNTTRTDGTVCAAPRAIPSTASERGKHAVFRRVL